MLNEERERWREQQEKYIQEEYEEREKRRRKKEIYIQKEYEKRNEGKYDDMER